MNTSYKHNITLLFLLLASIPAFSQFRMIGTASWTVVTDSTYSGTINFQVDLTGKGYLATSVVDTFRLFTGTEQIYTITTVGTKTFSSAQVTIKEYNGDHGIPIGQVMVYDPAGKTTLPQAPFGSTGSTAQLQAAVDTYNARLLSAISSLADGDKGDITVSASGATWTIDNNTITGDKISSGAVGADEIASGAVGPDELAATSVTPGAYTAANLTIDQDGRIELAADGETLYNGGTFSLGSTHDLLETELGAYSTRFRNSAGAYMGLYSDTTDGDFIGLKWVTLRGTYEIGETLSEFRMKFANDTRFELSNPLDRFYFEGTFDTDDTNTAALAVDPVTYELELVSIPENQIIDTFSYTQSTGTLLASLLNDAVPASSINIPNIGNSDLTTTGNRILTIGSNTFIIDNDDSDLTIGDITGADQSYIDFDNLAGRRITGLVQDANSYALFRVASSYGAASMRAGDAIGNVESNATVSEQEINLETFNYLTNEGNYLEIESGIVRIVDNHEEDVANNHEVLAVRRGNAGTPVVGMSHSLVFDHGRGTFPIHLTGIKSTWTDVTTNFYEGDLIFQTTRDYAMEDKVRIANDTVALLDYGSGTNTGTVAYLLAVDSTGNIIETTAGGGATPQYAQSYNEGGENSSITAGTPEQIVSTTIGTTDTIVTTSEFLVQADADIQYNGSDNAVVKITAEAAIDISNAAYVLYYIAINGTVQPSSKFRVYSAGTGSIPMSVNITYIDSDADNGDVYSLYAESTTGTVGYTVATLRMLAEKIK